MKKCCLFAYSPGKLFKWPVFLVGQPNYKLLTVFLTFLTFDDLCRFRCPQCRYQSFSCWSIIIISRDFQRGNYLIEQQLHCRRLPIGLACVELWFQTIFPSNWVHGRPKGSLKSWWFPQPEVDELESRKNQQVISYIFNHLGVQRLPLHIHLQSGAICSFRGQNSQRIFRTKKVRENSNFLRILVI